MREEVFEPVRFGGWDSVRDGEEMVEIARYSMRENEKLARG